MSIIGRHLTIMSLSAGVTFNPLDKGSGITLSGGNLIAAQTLTSAWQSVRAKFGKSSGKAVFEMKFSSSSSSLIVGFANSAALMSSFLGDSSLSVGFQGGGGGYHATGVTTAGTAPSSSTSPYMFAIDLDAGKGWICSGGVWANSGDPAAGTNPSFTWTGGTTIYPACSVFTTGLNVTLNAGDSAFSNTVPSGFSSGWF